MIARVKIGGRTYTVEEIDREFANDADCWGDCNPELGRIRVYRGERPADAVAETLIHEILHALFKDIGLDWTAEDEELTVSRLSPRLAAFMADNPNETRQLLDMLKGTRPHP